MVGRGGAGGASGGAAAARRVSFLFRRSQGAGHCAGVNALALSSDDQQLWTGSRDAVITCWDTAAESPALLHEHVGHTDWVNDLVLLGDVLVSCSSDKTLRVWQPNAPEPALGCLTGHNDYVTSLAASTTGNVLASGGLRGEVLLWDLAGLRKVMSGGAPNQEYGASAAEVSRDSVYAIDMNAAGTLLATGSTQSMATIVDARSGQSVMQLKGHTDNIRALQLDAEGRLLLTGSSDHTMRLWDLGQQRCVQTLAVHTDSVWALAASSSFATVYSGGRDGCIYRTRLANRVSDLIAVEQHPVLRLAVGQEEDHLWASTMSPVVHKWRIEASEAQALPLTPRSQLGAGPSTLPGTSTCFVASPSAAVRARLAFDVHGSRPSPQQLQPAAATPGVPPLQQTVILTDRRHVLTQDMTGNVEMWDVTSGTVVRDFGHVDIKEVEKELFQPSHFVSSWFAPDVKLGSLAGTMELPQCFSAEIYAQDLGNEEAPVDLKVNFGEQMVVALFRQWAALSRQDQQQAQAQLQQSDQLPLPPLHQRQVHQLGMAGGIDGGKIGVGSVAGSTDGDAAEADAPEQPSPGTGSSMQDPDERRGAGIGVEPPGAPASRFTFQGPLAPMVMVTGSGAAVPWCCPIDSFTGEEDVPQWVAECVLHGLPLGREQKGLKLAFQLMPLPNSGLPSLLQSKLNAPRVLRVNKVADYVRRKMEEHGIYMREEPLYWDPSKADRWQLPAQQAGAEASGGASSSGVHQLQPMPAAGTGGDPRRTSTLLLTCNGHAVPYEFSLAAVKQWIWRRSDDLVLHYGLRDNTPLKLPAIKITC